MCPNFVRHVILEEWLVATVCFFFAVVSSQLFLSVVAQFQMNEVSYVSISKKKKKKGHEKIDY